MFLVLSYVSSTRSKMILSAGVIVLAWGILDKQAEGQVLWSHWFLALAPLAIPTILASWLTIRWLSPPEPLVQPADPTAWHTLWHWACSESVPGAGNGVYQNTGLILGYPYGYFQARDVLTVGTVLTVVEGGLLLMLVICYWPLIGLSWRTPLPARLPGHAAEAAA